MILISTLAHQSLVVRQDDPRLLVRSAERRAARVARGELPDPVKVTVTGVVGLPSTFSKFCTQLDMSTSPVTESPADGASWLTWAQSAGSTPSVLLTVVVQTPPRLDVPASRGVVAVTATQ